MRKLRPSQSGNIRSSVVTTIDEAIDVANEIAAEHLTLSVDEPFDYLEKIRHAGALFLGRYTPPSVADYIAGPNHVLPTGATAVFSALSIHDYTKISNIVYYTKEELSKVKDHLIGWRPSKGSMRTNPPKAGSHEKRCRPQTGLAASSDQGNRHSRRVDVGRQRREQDRHGHSVSTTCWS